MLYCRDMVDEISRIVHESGLAKAIEVTCWADRPDSPMVTPETKHWISVGIGQALTKKDLPSPEEERRLLDGLAGLRVTLSQAGFKFEAFENQYWFVVTGKSRTDQEIIDFDPCAGNDCQIDCRTVKVVTTRKEHQCLGMGGAESVHTIPAGTRARYDRARVDGDFGSFYCCAECIEKYMASEGM